MRILSGLMIFGLLVALPLPATASTEAYMTWQITSASGAAGNWESLEFDVGIGIASFSLHGALIFPSNEVPLNGTCVYENATLIRCKANATLMGIEMLIDLSGPELQLDFTTRQYSVFGVVNGSGSAVPVVIGYLN